MRIFTSDTPSGLAVPAGSLPRPWVMPRGASPTHRRRLSSLLASAIRPFEPALWLVEVPWVERDSLVHGSLQLPPSSLVWWQVDRHDATPAATLLAEGSRIAPGFCLFDFARDIDVPAEAWLGPLKMAVLHELLDHLHDDRPVAAYEKVAEALEELAKKIVSPIDLLDAADLLLSHSLRGVDPLTVTSEVLAHVLSDQSEALGRDQDVLRLATVFRDEPEISEKDISLGDAPLGPMARWIEDPAVAARVVELVGQRAGMAPPVLALASKMVASPSPLGKKGLPEATSPEKQSEVLGSLHATAVRQAVQKSLSGDTLGAADALLSAVRRHEDGRWTDDERRAAAHLLLEGASLETESPERPAIEHAAALSEAAAECASAPSDPELTAKALVHAARCRQFLDQDAAAAALLARADELMGAATDPDLFVQYANAWAYSNISPERAGELAPRLIALVRSSGETLGDETRVGALFTAGLLLQAAGHPDAERDLEAARVAASEASLHVHEASAWVALGDLAHAERDLRRAARAYEAAAALFHSMSWAPAEAATLERLGAVALQRGELRRAQEAFEDALVIHQKAGDRVAEARVSAELARTIERRHQVISRNGATPAAEPMRLSAVAVYDGAIQRARDLADKQLLAALLTESQALLQDVETRRQRLEEARRLSEEVGDTRLQATALLRLAGLDRDAPETVDRLKEAARLYLETGEPVDAGRALFVLGRLLEDRADHPRARSAYREAIQIAPGSIWATQAEKRLRAQADSGPATTGASPGG